MAKKKNTQKGGHTQPHMSPEKYLRSGAARRLEIGTCYVCDSIEEDGEGIIIVSRKHNGGRISFASFLVDIFCLGVKDTFYRMRLMLDEFEDYIEQIDDALGIRECTYEEAHNWVWGGVAWAEDGGIPPHKDFAITQFMLEDDTEDVPLIDLPFGKDGKHFLMANSMQEMNQYMPTLIKNLGDDFDWALPKDFDISDSPLFKSYGPDTEYTYQHPDYPTNMELRSPQWVYDALMSTEHFTTIEPDTLDQMLTLPREDLRHDLEQIILYHTGLTCDGIPDNYDANGFSGVIGKAVMLLGEVGDPDTSLDVVLEVLRQNEAYFDYHIGDYGNNVFSLTLYRLGRNRFDKLMAFVKEEGLYSFAKSFTFDAPAYTAHYEPERRAEVLEWFREVLQFATQALPQTQCFDTHLSGLVLFHLFDIGARELLSEIKAMFDTELVDLGACGNYDSVAKDIGKDKDYSHHFHPLDLYELFNSLRRFEEREKNE